MDPNAEKKQQEGDVKFSKSGPLKFINKKKDGKPENTPENIPKTNQKNTENKETYAEKNIQKTKIDEKVEKKEIKIEKQEIKQEKQNEKKEKTENQVKKEQKIEKKEPNANVKQPLPEKEKEKNTPKQETSPKNIENPNPKQVDSDKISEKIDEIKKKPDENNEYSLGSLSSKNKKISDKSLKLNSSSFFAGFKPDSTSEFKPQTTISEFKPPNVTNTENSNIKTETPPPQTPQNKEENPALSQNSSLKKLPSDTFKLTPGDAHLSLKFIFLSFYENFDDKNDKKVQMQKYFTGCEP